MHGDEGDDQHGLKVHEIHDMQPELPNSVRHHGDTPNPAATPALHDSDQQHDASAQLLVTEPLVAATAAPAVAANSSLVLSKALMMSYAEEPEQTDITSSKGQQTSEPVIDLCSPIKSKQPSTQPQQGLQLPQLTQSPQLQEGPQLKQSPLLQQCPQLEQAPQLQQNQPSQTSSLQQEVQSLVPLTLVASDDDFPELRCHVASRTQDSDPALAVLHDLRPAGVQDDQFDHLASVTQTGVAHLPSEAVGGSSLHATGAATAEPSPSMQASQRDAPRQVGNAVLFETSLSASGQTLPPTRACQPEVPGKSGAGTIFRPELQSIEAELQGCRAEVQSYEPESQDQEPELHGCKPESQSCE